MNKIFMIGMIGLLLVGLSSAYICINYQEYKIPQLIPEDYNCEEHPGFISDSNPFLFESSQHYINRKNKAIQNQIKEVCNND